MNSGEANRSVLQEAGQKLRQLIGKERSIEEVSRELTYFAHKMSAPVVGAMHIVCADESELESSQAFQQGFVNYLLPKIKFGHQSAFRIANPGARYEWGAVQIAEEHFATSLARDRYKLMVVKVNAHVAVEWPGVKETFGRLLRYDCESACCGALSALLAGEKKPFLDELREVFNSEGKDRRAALLDRSRVDPKHRSLCASLVSARLQARQVVLDVQHHTPVSPTVYLIVPCVTLNRARRDAEILCGVYTVDHRTEAVVEEYVGLGDDPASYKITKRHDRYLVEDEQFGQNRVARDHRELVLQRWRQSSRDFRPKDERLDKIRHAVKHQKHLNHAHAGTLLKSLLILLGELSPISAAVLLFAQGVAGIHHVHRAHRLANELSGSGEAQEILDEIHARLDTFEPERARALVELLVHEHSRK